MKGVLKAILHQALVALVLAYNALTALPTQLLLGTLNSAIFLAYDGPRLALASMRGEVRWKNSEGNVSRDANSDKHPPALDKKSA